MLCNADWVCGVAVTWVGKTVRKDEIEAAFVAGTGDQEGPDSARQDAGDDDAPTGLVGCTRNAPSSTMQVRHFFKNTLLAILAPCNACSHHV